jgi:hypothetical protein
MSTMKPESGRYLTSAGSASVRPVGPAWRHELRGQGGLIRADD